MITGFAFIILITVVVTMRTMYMLMCNFFFSCSAHFSDFQGCLLYTSDAADE